MARVTRRGALRCFSGLGLSAVLAETGVAAEPEGAPRGKSELFVVGPFLLGDWLQKEEVSIQKLDDILKVAPDDKVTVKALNECKLYVIDQRIRKGTKWGFGDEPPYPVLAAQGKLAHAWKKRNQSFTIQVTESRAHVSSTSDSTRPRGWRLIVVSLQMDLNSLKDGATTWFSYSFTPLHGIAYDLDGKQLRTERPEP
jgi:hypothetical protein